MSDPADVLRALFAAQEHLAPDVASIEAGLRERAQTHLRRRRLATTVGGTTVGAGLVAALVTVPGLASNDGGAGGSATALPASPGRPAAPSAVVDAPKVVRTTAPPRSPRASATPDRQTAIDAYSGAGYGYQDALALIRIWKTSQDPLDVKAEAGRRLLAGETLPITPHPDPTTTAPAIDPAVKAYFAAGYGYDDAVKLAAIWHLSGFYEAKVEGGKRLLAGRTLPIEP